jgi:response regulator RpfG family c-di-GMP phosphodiesterase
MKKVSVLLIDDDKTFNIINRALIQKINPEIQVIEFTSSALGLDYLGEKILTDQPLPDFLFLDIRMPEMTGFEFLHILTSQFTKDKLKDMRIFILTSSLDAKDKESARESGVVEGFINKPLELEVLDTLFKVRSTILGA